MFSIAIVYIAHFSWTWKLELVLLILKKSEIVLKGEPRGKASQIFSAASAELQMWILARMKYIYTQVQSTKYKLYNFGDLAS